MRKPFRKNLQHIEHESAHGGSGSRQLILSKFDPVSSQFEAMTKGFLAAGGSFDWHHHDGVDEFFLVLQGTGTITFRNGEKFDYSPDDVIYIPANTEHRIDASEKVENQFYFVRLNS